MPIKRPLLINNEIYHIVIRGVGDSLIFKDVNDCYRGIFSIYEFNNANPVSIIKRREKIKNEKNKIREIRGLSLSKVTDERDCLVEILTFCFIPNHIHLLLKQTKGDGITDFMRKLGTGYAGYFNKRYNRKGHLFQNRFRAVHIKNNRQLKNVFVYIHGNALSLAEPRWKERGIKNPEKIIKFLESYKWSSYQDYIGKKNFPSVTTREFLLKIMGGEINCRKIINNYIGYKKSFKGLSKIALE